MRKNLIAILISIQVVGVVTPVSASTPFSQITTNQNEYFDSQLTLSQLNADSNGFVSGVLNAQLNLSNIRPQFLEYVSESHMNCYVKFEPQWDTYYEIFYDAIISEDPNFEDPERYFTFAVELKLDIRGNIIWNSTNPNYSFLIQDWRSGLNEDYPLSDYFKPSGNGIIGKQLQFPIEGGKKYYLKESLSAIENVRCLNNYNSGASLGEIITKYSDFAVGNIAQELTYSVPKIGVPLKSQAVRITYSASSGLPVEAIEVDARVCIINGTVVILKSTGSCQITLSQEGGNGFAPITRTAAFEITGNSKSSTIVCVKGKIKKNVSGINPKCPAGYKKK